MKEGSRERARLAKEYDYLRNLGHAEGMATELAALRSCFGPVDRIKETTKPRAESHQETGTPAGEVGEPEKGPKISPRLKAHYEKMIEKRHFTGWDDPKLKKELEYAPRPS
ncbi:hypothetical protein AMJ82_11570 [candidate division TA06 bacterium SM23_40]|uniref:Uncharacterized protein n=1 Tax=candidate division TA06 bacterium SM23_40 TaxID=1703774 RepID=A0A0S8G4E5_UNCT6|nr:MAG: hypothetical protein AMJ82_11570 [candidate division TA06 bacterium SM23_40]